MSPLPGDGAQMIFIVGLRAVPAPARVQSRLGYLESRPTRAGHRGFHVRLSRICLIASSGLIVWVRSMMLAGTGISWVKVPYPYRPSGPSERKGLNRSGMENSGRRSHTTNAPVGDTST